jgi:hypothetical protein
MLKIQICWSILRYFNYDDQLKIKVNKSYSAINEKDGDSA